MLGERVSELRLDAEECGLAVRPHVGDERIERRAVVEVLPLGTRRVLDAHVGDFADLARQRGSHHPRRKRMVVHERPEQVEAHRLAREHVAEASKWLHAGTLRDATARHLERSRA